MVSCSFKNHENYDVKIPEYHQAIECKDVEYDVMFRLCPNKYLFDDPNHLQQCI